MQRTQQILFAILCLATCWLAMQAVHEAGHVIGALLTGAVIEKVILFPLTISSTIVSNNPRPGIVVWLGPILGVLLPLTLIPICPKNSRWRNMAMFFAGFCLIANGAYIGIGSLDEIGDCKSMLESGSAVWMLILFGLCSATCGLLLWHRLGSISDYFSSVNLIKKIELGSVAIFLVLLLSLEFVFSPR